MNDVSHYLDKHSPSTRDQMIFEIHIDIRTKKSFHIISSA